MMTRSKAQVASNRRSLAVVWTDSPRMSGVSNGLTSSSSLLIQPLLQESQTRLTLMARTSLDQSGPTWLVASVRGSV